MTFLEPVGEMSLQNNELKSKERQVPTGDYKITRVCLLGAGASRRWQELSLVNWSRPQAGWQRMKATGNRVSSIHGSLYGESTQKAPFALAGLRAEKSVSWEGGETWNSVPVYLMGQKPSSAGRYEERTRRIKATVALMLLNKTQLGKQNKESSLPLCQWKECMPE